MISRCETCYQETAVGQDMKCRLFLRCVDQPTHEQFFIAIGMRPPGVQANDDEEADCRRVTVPLSTLLALFHHEDCRAFAAQLQLPLDNWLQMKATWESREGTDLKTIVARLAALDHCQHRVTSLAHLLGLAHALDRPKWGKVVEVPTGTAEHSAVMQPSNDTRCEVGVQSLLQRFPALPLI